METSIVSENVSVSDTTEYMNNEVLVEVSISNSSVNTDVTVRNLVENDSEKVINSSIKVNSHDVLLDSLLDSVVNESAENGTKETENNISVINSSLNLETGVNNVEALSLTETDEITETEDVIIDNVIESVTEKNDLTISTSEFKIEKLCQLPYGRVKTIMKSDPEVNIVSAESIFLISKATELFLQWLGKQVHSYTIQQKKKTIQLRDLNMAISDHPALEFLDGALD